MEAQNATTEEKMAALKATDEYEELKELAEEAESPPVWEQNMVRNKNKDDKDTDELPPRDLNKNYGTRPMTGQPRTTDSLTKAVQDANKLDDDIEKGFDDDDDMPEADTLEEYRAKKAARRNDDDDTEMQVTKDGETTTHTKDEWDDKRRSVKRIWNRLDRKGGVYVAVEHWFNDAKMNKVKSGRGFHAEITDETEKAYQFSVGATEGQSPTGETVWVPKKAVTVYKLT